METVSHSLYKTKKWGRIRKRVYVRDNFTCFKCGDSGGGVRLNAHHIIPIAFCRGSGLEWDKSNLVTLCERCHTWVHEIDDYFNPYKPDGSAMRSWRFAVAAFLMFRFFPGYYGEGKPPRKTRKRKRRRKRK